MRYIIIGDIHGCYDELQTLLDAIGPGADDQIIALGDIVDRGPDSEKVLSFFRDVPNATSIMGNHERKHLSAAQGKTRAALAQKIVKAQLGDRYDEWLTYMKSLPRLIELPEAILVHGMFEPGVPLQEQRDTVVIGTLTGEHYLEQTYPGPWYDHYKGPKPLVCGHHHYLRTGEPLTREGLLYAIDTGVAHGARLTALILPDFEIVSVPARADHWTQQRMRYAALAGSGKSNLDLDLETLEGYARSADAEGLPEPQRQRALACAEIVAECDRLVPAIVEAVTSLCQSILDELAQDPTWAKLARNRQASRFAQRAQEHACAELLYPARKGKLNESLVRKRAKTPRGLATFAEQLGVEHALGQAEAMKK